MRVVLLIARYQEDLTWIEEVPTDFEVVVLNKGEALPLLRNNAEIIPSDNVGREAEAYVNYIVRNYEDLPDRIIFTQGDPFEHSPFFLELIRDFQTWQGFQPLTLQFKDYLPPKEVREVYDKVAFYNRVWVDRADCRTLNTVFYDDPDFRFFAESYRTYNRLDASDNLVTHFLASSGFQVSATEAIDEVNFSFGAIFSVDSATVKKHAKLAYSTLLIKFREDNDDSLPYIAERCWMALFDEANAVRESPWSLPLSRKANRIVLQNPSEVHAGNLGKPFQGPANPNTANASIPLTSARDFVVEKQTTMFVKSRTLLRSVRTPCKNPVTYPGPCDPRHSTPSLHPNRDFVIAKPPTRHRHKV